MISKELADRLNAEIERINNLFNPECCNYERVSFSDSEDRVSVFWDSPQGSGERFLSTFEALTLIEKLRSLPDDSDFNLIISAINEV